MRQSILVGQGEDMFRGSYVALVTPFQKNGRVDWKRIEKWIEWHIASRTDGVVCAASTGEGIALTDKERNKLIEVCVKSAGKRIQVIANTGLPNTAKTVEATEKAKQLGADGALVVTPYYVKPTQRGCLLHFQEVAKTGLPIIVYHNPSRAAIKMSADAIAEISQIPGIVGYKDSTHDLDLLKKVRKMCPKLALVSGDDDFTFALLREGGDGVISVIGNLFPEGWGKMVHKALEGKWVEAERLFARYLPLCKALFLETNPQGVKYGMSWLGKCRSQLRLPLVEPVEATQKELKKAILHIAFPQFGKREAIQV